MEQYTDDERVEDLKKWWKENGGSIITGIVLGLVAIVAWQYWTSYRTGQAEQASQAYDAFIGAVQKPDIEQARQRSQALFADYPKSPYATLAGLQLAKLETEQGHLPEAIQRLRSAIDNADLDEIKDIARLRLVRVLIATGQAADAEQQLNRVTTASLTAEREELRGDLAMASNDRAKARTAYAAALASSSNPLLQLKLDNLTLPTSDSLIPAPAAPPEPPAPAPTPAPPETTSSAASASDALPAGSAEAAPAPAPITPAPTPTTETAPAPEAATPAPVPTTETAPAPEAATPAPTPTTEPTAN